MTGEHQTGFDAGRWSANWIWDARADEPGDSAADSRRVVVALRSSRTIHTVPATAPLRVAAVSRYVLRLNGVEVARGPVRTSPHLQRYDVVDVAPLLHEGDNEIQVLAWRYLDPMPWWAPPPPFTSDISRGGVAAELQLADEQWVTDGSWQSAYLPTWALARGRGVANRGRERIDPAALRDAQWQPATQRVAHAVGEAWRPHPPTLGVGPVGPRPIPMPTARPVALTEGPAGIWTSPDGVVSGIVEVTFTAPPGDVLTVQVSERLDGERPAPTEHDAGFELVGSGATETIETLDAFGLTALTVDGGDVTGVRVVERAPDPGTGADFRCSDAVLERIWSVGRRTVTLCSTDAYLDCPTREQRAWTGDGVVHQMVDLTTSTDWSLARWYSRLGAAPRSDGMLPMAVAGEIEHFDYTVIPDWALHWVHGVHNLYRYAGDRDEIASLLPVVEGVVRWFLSWRDPATGLLVDVPGWVIIDWAAVASDGASAALNGLWGRALLELADMSQWLGDEGRAGTARALHAELGKGFELLWDAERERYADVRTAAGELRPAASQHGQAAAVVGGLVPEHRRPRLAALLTDTDRLVHAAFSNPTGPVTPLSEQDIGGRSLREPLPPPWWEVGSLLVAAQPFFRYVVHDALHDLGRTDAIVERCRDWAILLERCPTSWSETWYGGTICHGWSSTPTRDLMTRVLGVTPAAPGFTEVSVEPALGDLEWAAGRVPTPYGSVTVEVTPERIAVDSPVPVRLRGELLPAGSHESART